MDYMNKQKLLDVINSHKDGDKYDDHYFTSTRDYHEPKDIMDVVRCVIEEYGELTDGVNEVDDMRDDLNEAADSQTPIYNRDLLIWLADNHTAYEETIDEMGEIKDSSGKTDLIRGIMFAYCRTLENDAMSALESVWNEAEEDAEIDHDIEEEAKNKAE